MERAQDLVRSALRAMVAVAKVEGASQVREDDGKGARPSVCRV